MSLKSALIGLVLITLSQFASAFGEITKNSQTYWCADGAAPPYRYCGPIPTTVYAQKFLDAYRIGLGLTLHDGIGNPIGYTQARGSATCTDTAVGIACSGLVVCDVVNGVAYPCTGMYLELVSRQYDKCPTYSTENKNFAPSKCFCDKNYQPRFVGGNAICAPYVSALTDAPLSCPANPAYGKPIFPLSGSKRLTIELGSWLGQSVALKYDSRHAIASASSAVLREVSTGFDYLPQFWGLTLFKSLNVQADIDHLNVGMRIQAIRGPGVIQSFRPGATPNLYTSSVEVNDRLEWDGATWNYYDASSDAIERYNYDGVLQNISFADGRLLNYSYSDKNTPQAVAPAAGLPILITDQRGRTLNVGYTVRNGRPLIASLTDSAGEGVSISYDANENIESVAWLNSTSKRKFLYENTAFPWAVTGIEDEPGIRLATFGYDDQGRANATQLAGSVNKFTSTWSVPPKIEEAEQYDVWQRTIDSYSYSWTPPQGISVTLPNGETSSVTTKVVLGTPRVAGQSQPAGAGCTASSNSQDFDANGNLTWKEGFNGYRTCYANDLSRNLETSRVEGLSTGSSCSSVLAANATLPANSRKVTTSWHPQWRMAAKTAEPRLITTYIYNGQPDTTHYSNRIASCAPSTATLPDGRPIVVLCKKVEQATLDTNGAQGFSATADPNAPARVHQWTYNASGQALTYVDPLTNTTQYSYYSDTTAEHTKGDLNTITNAKNQVTTYNKYNVSGQWLEMKDVNDVLTTRTFDTRQRLKSVKKGTAETTYDYWPTGLLQKVTLADNSSLTYGYDDAQRLTSVTDTQGNSITYTLDNSGVVKQEDVKDPSGQLKKTLSRVPDALGRIQQVTGRR